MPRRAKHKPQTTSCQTDGQCVLSQRRPCHACRLSRCLRLAAPPVPANAAASPALISTTAPAPHTLTTTTSASASVFASAPASASASTSAFAFASFFSAPDLASSPASAPAPANSLLLLLLLLLFLLLHFLLPLLLLRTGMCFSLVLSEETITKRKRGWSRRKAGDTSDQMMVDNMEN